MKKFILMAAVFCGCVFFSNEKIRLSAAAGETQNPVVGTDENDLELAKTIRELTNRSDKGLTIEKRADGLSSMDLQGRFQNVMLARLEPDGEPLATCVTSLKEANSFFGKNLETGEPVAQTQFQKDDIARVAARHGMNVEEYLFYNRMIAETARRESLSPESASFSIQNNDGAGEGFNDATVAPWFPGSEGGNSAATLGAARLAVFNQAANIWGAYLDSNVPTVVAAQFNPQTCTATSAVLGSAGTINIFSFSSGAPYLNTWYHSALTNKIARTDASGATAEITATFNSNLNGSPGCLGGRRFYFGFDNASPGGNINLLVVVLHEMGHGLGFSNFVDETTGANNGGVTDIYSQFTFDRTANKYWSQMTNAERQASAINTGNVFWDGANVKLASGFLTGGRDTANGSVELYAPNPVEPGSSISHFSTTATTNLLMEPFINTGLPLDLDLTRQQMRDIGWFRDTNTADTTADAVANVTPNTGTLIIGSSTNITWTNVGGFSQNVAIELSTDGGLTFPTTIAANQSNTGSYSWTVPNIPTTQARIRVREVNFASPSAVSAANFSISTLTAASVSVTGRVLTSAGRGIAGVSLRLTDSFGNTRTALTNAFGYYRFAEVAAGENHILSAVHKRYNFSARVVNLDGDLTDLNLVANP